MGKAGYLLCWKGFSQIVFCLHIVVVFFELKVVVFAFIVGDRLGDGVGVFRSVPAKRPYVDLVFVLVFIGFFVKLGFIEFSLGLFHDEGHVVALGSEFLEVDKCILVVFAGFKEFAFGFFAWHFFSGVGLNI